jgi:hypothetical protein
VETSIGPELIIIYEFSLESSFGNRVFKFFQRGSIGRSSDLDEPAPDFVANFPPEAPSVARPGGPGHWSPHEQ